MEYVDPIREIEKIEAIKCNLQNQSLRDLLLFVLGINTGIRISDLLQLKVSDIRNENGLKDFLCVKDGKTDEIKSYYLNNKVKTALRKYLDRQPLTSEDYLFKSRKNNLPITRQQAYRIINTAAKDVGITSKIGTHTLRKTFGYHAYRKGIAISILKSLFSHHSPSETMRYIGINKEENHPIKLDVNL
ncbi:tyrosine-type recombinase/integrase [Sutcliffiella rhizosphaerae]|uniref:Tyrosine recombinase XerC n=1 Tax=Sutcliffiella rhizosphaerae TaxID=2880967 RepID=A0ABN8AAH4_9BACI|nr:tyrosine-type recombinase/integrase [Sutcliffiella rhizosphaerae]CAG9620063.1 Tyrosine recombinase XerC [Sutcliffiella rhizosphaerae]